MSNVPYCHFCHDFTCDHPHGMGGDHTKIGLIREVQQKIDNAETSREADFYKNRLQELLS